MIHHADIAAATELTRLQRENAQLRADNAVLAAEVRAWRECPPDHFSRVWDSPSMSGKHRSPYREALNERKASTDASGALARATEGKP